MKSLVGLKAPVDGSKVNIKGFVETEDHVLMKFAVKKCMRTTKTGEKCYDVTDTNY